MTLKPGQKIFDAPCTPYNRSLSCRILAFILSLLLSFEPALLAAASLAPAVSFSSASIALPQTLEIQIPESLGRIQERFLPNSSSKDAPALIYIQDLHANPEAQKNIAELLKILVRQYGIDTVTLEGAFEEIHPEQFRFFDSKIANARAAESLVALGEMTGAELFGVTEHSEARFYGVDNRSLYKKSYRLFNRIYSRQPAFEKILAVYFQELEKAEHGHYSKALMQFAQERRQLKREKQENLFEYFQLLKKLSAEHLELDLAHPRSQFDWPNASRLARIEETEKKIQSETVSRELSRLIEVFKRLPRTEDSAFVLQGLEILVPKKDSSLLGAWLKSQKNFKTVRQFFEVFYETAAQAKIPIFLYPQLLDTAGLLILKEEIQSEGLFHEIERLETKIENQLAQTEIEKQLLEQGKALEFLERLWHLRLTRFEYENQKSLFNSRRFLQITQTKAGVPFLPKKLSRMAQEFYRLSAARDRSLVERSLRYIKKGKPVVLIAGGFHSGGIEKILKSKNIPHLILTPQAGTKLSSDLYQKAMTGKNIAEVLENQDALVKPLVTQFNYGAVSVRPEEQRRAAVLSIREGLRTETRTSQQVYEFLSALLKRPANAWIFDGAQVGWNEKSGEVSLRFPGEQPLLVFRQSSVIPDPNDRFAKPRQQIADFFESIKRRILSDQEDPRRFELRNGKEINLLRGKEAFISNGTIQMSFRAVEDSLVINSNQPFQPYEDREYAFQEWVRPKLSFRSKPLEPHKWLIIKFKNKNLTITRLNGKDSPRIAIDFFGRRSFDVKMKPAPDLREIYQGLFSVEQNLKAALTQIEVRYSSFFVRNIFSSWLAGPGKENFNRSHPELQESLPGILRMLDAVTAENFEQTNWAEILNHMKIFRRELNRDEVTKSLYYSGRRKQHVYAKYIMAARTWLDYAYSYVQPLRDKQIQRQELRSAEVVLPIHTDVPISNGVFQLRLADMQDQKATLVFKPATKGLRLVKGIHENLQSVPEFLAPEPVPGIAEGDFYTLQSGDQLSVMKIQNIEKGSVQIQFLSEGKTGAKFIQPQADFTPGLIEIVKPEALAKLHPIKKYVFDWEGVIQDSARAIEMIETDMLSELIYGELPSESEKQSVQLFIEGHHHLTFKGLFEWALQEKKRLNLVPGAETSWKEFLSLYVQTLLIYFKSKQDTWREAMPLVPGIETLLSLAKSRAKIYVATNLVEAAKQAQIEAMGFGKYFPKERVYGAESDRAFLQGREFSKALVTQHLMEGGDDLSSPAAPDEMIFTEDNPENVRRVKESTDVFVIAMARDEKKLEEHRKIGAADIIVHGDFSQAEALMNLLPRRPQTHDQQVSSLGPSHALDPAFIAGQQARAELRISEGLKAQRVNELIQDNFRQLRQMPLYKKLRTDVIRSRNGGSQPVRDILHHPTVVSLEGMGIRADEVTVNSVIEAVTTQIKDDKTDLRLFLDDSDAYKPFDEEIATTQKNEQARLESEIDLHVEKIRTKVVAGELKLFGSESEDTIKEIEDRVKQWILEGDEAVIFIGDGIQVSANFLLQALTHREEWNSHLKKINRPQIFFMNSHDPVVISRLIEQLKARKKIRIVHVGPRDLGDQASISELTRQLPQTVLEDSSNEEIFNGRTLGLFVAGMLDPKVESPTYIRQIHSSAKEAYQSWLNMEGKENLKNYPAYRLAAHQVRFAKTGITASVLIMFSTVLQHFSNYLAQLLNEKIGTAQLPFFVSGESATVYFHSTQQGWMESVLYGHNEEYESRSRKGFLGFSFFSPIRSFDLAVQGNVNRNYKGFGQRFLLRIAQVSLKLCLRLARGLIIMVNFESDSKGDLGRLLFFGQIAGEMAGQLSGHNPALDQVRHLNQAIETKLAQTSSAEIIPDGEILREQNILTLRRDGTQIKFEGVIGDTMNGEGESGQNPQGLEGRKYRDRFLSIMTTFSSASGLPKVVKQFSDGDKLVHLNPDEIRSEIEKTKPAAERMLSKGPKRVYAYTIGGSTSGESMIDALNLQQGPEIIWITSYDPDVMEKVFEDLRQNPEQTYMVVISKSGNTFEVDANSETSIEQHHKELATFMKQLGREAKDTALKSHVLFVTDPKQGDLQEKVKAGGWNFIDHPIFIGGRFSMFSSVGLIFYFLKGGTVEALEPGLKKWEEWRQLLRDRTSAILDQGKILENKEHKFTEDERIAAAYQVYELVKDIPGVWEGFLDNFLNTLSVSAAKDREVALGYSESFKKYLGGPLFRQIRVESKSKPGVSFYAFAFWGWNAIKAVWNRISSDPNLYVTLFGEASSKEQSTTELSRLEQATWDAMKQSLIRQQIPFMSVRTGPMDAANLMAVQWIQYLRLAVDVPNYQPMKINSEGQDGVEGTKRFFSGYLKKVQEVIKRKTNQASGTASKKIVQRGDSVVLPYIPIDQTERMSDVPMNLEIMNFDKKTGEAVSWLIRGGASHMGLATRESKLELQDLPRQDVSEFLKNRILDLANSAPFVNTLYINGEKKSISDDGSIVIRVTSMESWFNANSGNPNGTSIGLYEDQHDGYFKLKATIHILWGSTIRVMVSDGQIAQDYVLLPVEDRLIEVDRPGERNTMLTAASGSYISTAGKSSEMPPAFVRFLENIISPAIAVKSRTANAPMVDYYQIFNKQGLVETPIGREAIAEYAFAAQAKKGYFLVMTPQGLRHGIELPVTEETFLSREFVYIYAGARDPVKQTEIFLNLLSAAPMEKRAEIRNSQPPILEILDILKDIPPSKPALRARVIMLALTIQSGLETLPKDLTGELKKLVKDTKRSIAELIQSLSVKQTIEQLSSEYVNLDTAERQRRAEDPASEFVLLGHRLAQLRNHPRVLEGDQMKLVCDLERRLERIALWDLLIQIKNDLTHIDNGLALAARLEALQSHLSKHYQANTGHHSEKPISAPPVIFGETVEQYLPKLPSTIPGIPDDTAKKLIVARNTVINQLLEIYSHDQKIPQNHADELQARIIKGLREEEPDIFYEKDGDLYVQSLEAIHENLRPRKASKLNRSGDISDRLDGIFNNLMIYFTRTIPGVGVIVSEEPLLDDRRPVPAVGKIILEVEGYRLILLYDPLDGTSQLTEAGTYGSMTAIGFMKPGQTFKDFDPMTQGLGGFKYIFGMRKFLDLFMPYNEKGEPAVVQFQYTKLDPGEEERGFRKAFEYNPLTRLEAEIENDKGWKNDSLIPNQDPAKVVRMAIGGADREFNDHDGHRELLQWLKRTYGYKDAYTGGLVGDIGELIDSVDLLPTEFIGVIHSYGPTREYPKGRYRLAFELIFYGWFFKYLGGEVSDGLKPMLHYRLDSDYPSEIKKAFYASNAWISKIVLGWRNDVKEHPPVSKRETEEIQIEMRQKFEDFIHHYEVESAKLLKNLQDYAKTKTISKDLQYFRYALFQYDGDIVPLFALPVAQVFHDLYHNGSFASADKIAASKDAERTELRARDVTLGEVLVRIKKIPRYLAIMKKNHLEHPKQLEPAINEYTQRKKLPPVVMHSIFHESQEADAVERRIKAVLDERAELRSEINISDTSNQSLTRRQELRLSFDKVQEFLGENRPYVRVRNAALATNRFFQPVPGEKLSEMRPFLEFDLLTEASVDQEASVILNAKQVKDLRDSSFANSRTQNDSEIAASQKTLLAMTTKQGTVPQKRGQSPMQGGVNILLLNELPNEAEASEYYFQLQKLLGDSPLLQMRVLLLGNDNDAAFNVNEFFRRFYPNVSERIQFVSADTRALPQTVEKVISEAHKNLKSEHPQSVGTRQELMQHVTIAAADAALLNRLMFGIRIHDDLTGLSLSAQVGRLTGDRSLALREASEELALSAERIEALVEKSVQKILSAMRDLGLSKGQLDAVAARLREHYLSRFFYASA